MGQRDERRAVRRERAPQLADLMAHLDQQLDVLVGSLAAHRVHVELLQPLLDSLEGGGVRPEHPFQQRR